MFASRLPSGGSGSRSSFHSASLYSAVHSTGLSGHFCPPTIPQWDIHLLDRNLLLRQSVLLWWPLDLSGFSLRYYVSSPRKKIFSSFPAKSLRLSPRKKILALFQENLSPHLRKRCRIRDFRQTDLAVLHPKTIPFNWGRKSRCLLEKSLALISYMCTHICTCVYRSEVDIGCLSSCHPQTLFFDTRSLTEPRAHIFKLSWLGSNVQWASCFCLPALGSLCGC